MEEKEGMKLLGLTVKKSDEVHERFKVVNNGENHGPIPNAAAMPIGMEIVSTEKVKKKRGRPRKYAGDGSLAVALSPMPISASIPLSGGGGGSGGRGGWKQSSRGGHGIHSLKKNQMLEFDTPSPIGERAATPYSGVSKFSPHVITINPGEDVAMKIISFSQQGNKAICVLSANGAISNVTLRQPNSSGGTITYEGHFEILSLTGSFIPNDNGATKSRSGGMSVSLVGPDGRLFGGGLAGILFAAAPVQVVLGSFLPGYQLEQYYPPPKKHNFEQSASFNTVTSQQQPLPTTVKTEGVVYCAPKMTHLPSSVTTNQPDNSLPVVTKISAPPPSIIYSSPAAAT